MSCLTRHPMTRRFVRRLALALAGSMLFMQLALAAYVCPSSPPAGSSSESVMPHPCGDMQGATDAASPSLCAEHCKAAAQSDQVPVPVPPVALFVALYRLTPLAPAAVPPRPAAATLSALFAAAPPHAILHCVHRI
jgi:hypothetical protein